MLANSWSIKLPHPPQSHLARLIDLSNPSSPQPSIGILYQTTGRKLFIHQSSQSRSLPFQKDISSLQVFTLGDSVIVAYLSNNTLTAYDVLNNTEKFVQEFELADIVHYTGQSLLVAGASTLYCVGLDGREVWNVQLSAGIVCVEGVGEFVYLGLDDRSVKIFGNESMVGDYPHLPNQPICICPIEKSSLIVGFKQGMVAVYQGKKAKWKAKSKHTPCQILLAQIQQMPQKSMLVARESGQIQVRSWQDGTIHSKINIQQPICRMFLSQFRKDGKEQLVVIAASGSTRGYNLVEKMQVQKNLIGEEKETLAQVIQDLRNRRMDLEREVAERRREGTTGAVEEDSQEILKENFQLKWDLVIKNGIVLKIMCKNGFVRGLVFEEPLTPYFQKPAEKLNYEIEPTCTYVGVVRCQALVSSYPSNDYQTKNIEFTLKKFWKWTHLPDQKPSQLQTFITFKHPQRIARYTKWLAQSFFLPLTQPQITKLQQQPILILTFKNPYQKQKNLLIIRVDSTASRVHLFSENLQLLSQLTQDLADYMNIKELEVDGKFPKEMATLKQKLSQIEEINKNKVNISSEIAESMAVIKGMVVRAENNRVLRDMGEIRRTYAEIMDENHKVCLEIRKKSQNAATLNEMLRYVGNMINLTANMRVGAPRTKVNTLCRQALKSKQFVSLTHIMEKGSE